ncbi:alpha/beta hydrolase [Acanthopleuribacter pedis]|uniref:Alpha/beta fold hydrolase n=1 Tax=Acanthopleuribacter pedis TaxID=442870 RepID=A0A8J7U2T5_9BACT|nr:alpha/beta fold hydrolase [Acanthopleuribacter pedis]MBO1318074.1 alpha/beta fold hydrolase [Acanthopleuribacter pedis]
MFRYFMLALLFTFTCTAQTRFIPHVTRAGGGFDTHISINNVATGPRAYTLTAFDQSGLATMVVSGNLAAGQSLQRDRTELFNGFPVSHLSVSGVDIHVGVAYRSTAAQGTPAEVFETTGTSTHWRLIPGNVNHAWDGIALVNTGTVPTAVEIVQVDGRGAVVHRTTPDTLQAVAPNSKGLYLFETDFAPVEQGWFEILSEVPLAITALRGSRDGAVLWQSEAVDLQTADLANPVDLTTKPVIFTPDFGEPIDAELGTFHVKENRDNPNSRLIPIHFVRLPATTSQPGPPIVYLAGGPGGSAVAAASGVRYETFDRMRAAADVILFEQRGTGRSDSIPTFTGWYQTPTDQPTTEALLTETVGAFAEAARAFWESKGVDLQGYTSVQSAHDLDAMRRALGVEQLTLWGISYGTHLAMTTARLYPNRIHRMILAGAEGPDDTLKRPLDADTVLEHIQTLIAADPLAAQQFPDFRADLRRVLAELATTPVSIAATNPHSGADETIVVGPYDLQLLLAGALSQGDTVRLVPQIVAAAAAGQYTLLGRFFQEARTGTLHAMGLATDLAAGASKTQRARVDREAAYSLLGNAPNVWMQGALAEKWLPALPFENRSPLQSDIPTLFIGGTLDGRTPISQQEALAEGFANAYHLILENGGHGDDLISGDPGIATTMIEFLAGQTEPTQTIVLPAPDFLSPPNKSVAGR